MRTKSKFSVPIYSWLTLANQVRSFIHSRLQITNCKCRRHSSVCRIHRAQYSSVSNPKHLPSSSPSCRVLDQARACAIHSFQASLFCQFAARRLRSNQQHASALLDGLPWHTHRGSICFSWLWLLLCVGFARQVCILRSFLLRILIGVQISRP